MQQQLANELAEFIVKKYQAKLRIISQAKANPDRKKLIVSISDDIQHYIADYEADNA